MRLFPKLPDNMGFWRKWNMFFVMFIGGCLLAARFYRHVPHVVDFTENLLWIGGGGLAVGIAMQFIRGGKQ